MIFPSASIANVANHDTVNRPLVLESGTKKVTLDYLSAHLVYRLMVAGLKSSVSLLG